MQCPPAADRRPTLCDVQAVDHSENHLVTNCPFLHKQHATQIQPVTYTVGVLFPISLSDPVLHCTMDYHSVKHPAPNTPLLLQQLRPCANAHLSLEETLICVPANKPGFHISKATPLQAPVERAGQASTAWTPAAACLPELVSALTAALGCSFFGIHMHAHRAALCPSLYLQTNSLQCATRQHASNHSVVELRCDNLQWRLLCRDGCRSGPWYDISRQLLKPRPGVAPAWLADHLTRWCRHV